MKGGKMQDEVGRASIRLRVIARSLYFIVGAFVLWIHVKDPGMNHFWPSKIDEMIHGTAWQPYVFRTLLPTTARVILRAIPQKTKDSLVRGAEKIPAEKRMFEILRWEPRFAPEYLV